ncbi:MAG: hypothetical protein Q3970_10205, partial [Neisseria sp.]|nr:hypothetical protein [Neisseria sp.]
MANNCNTYDEGNTVSDAVGASLTSADTGFKQFLEKFGAANIAKSKLNPAVNMFGHVGLLMSAGQVVQKYTQGNKQQAFIEFTSATGAFLGGLGGGMIGAATGPGAILASGAGSLGGAWLGREVGEWLVDQYRKASGDYHWTCPNEYEDYKNLNRDGKYHVYDPLVLDLDGDGIETVGTQGYNGALFDHNSD